MASLRAEIEALKAERDALCQKCESRSAQVNALIELTKTMLRVQEEVIAKLGLIADLRKENENLRLDCEEIRDECGDLRQLIAAILIQEGGNYSLPEALLARAKEMLLYDGCSFQTLIEPAKGRITYLLPKQSP